MHNNRYRSLSCELCFPHFFLCHHLAQVTVFQLSLTEVVTPNDLTVRSKPSTSSSCLGWIRLGKREGSPRLAAGSAAWGWAAPSGLAEAWDWGPPKTFAVGGDFPQKKKL